MSWDMSKLNVSATLNLFRVLARPGLCLPHATVSTFNDLPVPLSKAFEKYGKVDIRAVVLDKDDCFAMPNKNEIYGPYKTHFQHLRDSYPDQHLLIVSNTAGSTTADPSQALAALVTQNTHGVPVLQHSVKKPGCGAEILAYFRSGGNITSSSSSTDGKTIDGKLGIDSKLGIESKDASESERERQSLRDLRPDQIVIIGDRLLTDMCLANEMGSWGIWIRDGVVPLERKSIFTRLERKFGDFLVRRGYEPPVPESPFE